VGVGADSEVSTFAITTITTAVLFICFFYGLKNSTFWTALNNAFYHFFFGWSRNGTDVISTIPATMATFVTPIYKDGNRYSSNLELQ
jgi:hypothetical protein